MRCWKSNVEWAEETFGCCSDEWADSANNPGTCMLEYGHEGPHEFVSDSSIIIFVDGQA